MPHLPLRLHREAATADVLAALGALRAELDLPSDFPPEVLAESARAAAAAAMPDHDLTDIPFATIDPAGATDLDQAFAFEPDGAGWTFWYAIADLPAFVELGGAIDTEARTRGTTYYAADGRLPLHPPVISEGAASLLAGELRSALVWEFHLDAAARVTSTSLCRARIRSRRQWSYAEAQDALGDDPLLGMLRDVGEGLLERESERGGASLAIPEIIVTRDAAGFGLTRRQMLPVESWNAQLSLLTGMEAARMMLAGGIGILRTMPPAEPAAVARFRQQTIALGTPWPEDERYGDYLRRLSGDDPRHLAIRHDAASLFRGAAYRAFDGDPPEQTQQAAIGAPYAHVTAPLRRLIDRFGLEICLALSAGEEVPSAVRAALPDLPSAMSRAAGATGRLERRTLDIVEAAVLTPRLGEMFDAVAVSERTIQLEDPAVETECTGPLEPGAAVRVRLESADIASGTVRFRAV